MRAIVVSIPGPGIVISVSSTIVVSAVTIAIAVSVIRSSIAIAVVVPVSGTRVAVPVVVAVIVSGVAVAIAVPIVRSGTVATAPASAASICTVDAIGGHGKNCDGGKEKLFHGELPSLIG